MMNNHGQNSDQVYVKREKATRRASKEDQVIDGGGLSVGPAGTDHGDDEKPSLPHTQQPIEDDDPDDPIVHEIPVFLAKSLAKQLYLLQYPVRPCRMSYDTSTVLSARVKPKQKKVEVTMALNTQCTNFDTSKAKQIALNVDGSDAAERSHQSNNQTDGEDPMTFPEAVMDRLVLSSTQAVPDTSRYAVGILDANEFHLTPLDAVLSLRPSFDYLDKSDKTAKSEGRLLGMDTEEEEDIPASGSDAKEMKAVTVRFAKGGKMDQERVGKLKEKSFEFQQKMAKQEPWTSVRYNHVKTEKWQKESQKMFCKNMDSEVSGLTLKTDEYLETLK